MHVRHATSRCSSKVHGHGNLIFLGHVSDLVRFQDATGGGEIGMDLANSMPSAQDAKRLLQVNVLAG